MPGEIALSQTLFKGTGSAGRDRADRDQALDTAASSVVKAVAAKDLAIVAALPVSFVVAWTLSEPLWRNLARAASPLAACALTTQMQPAVERIERLVGDQPMACSPAAVVKESIAGHVEEFLQVLREYRPRAWQPEIRLEGRSHVDAALDRGRGAVLWVSHFSFAGLVAKKALSREGILSSHLSHPSHGFSRTRFGMRYLNRLRMHVEDRYLHERVMLSLDGATGAMRELHRRLRRNGVVSVTVRERAQRPSVVPFLNGTIKLATGAADLAYATGASLLPVFAVREPDGRYRVVVDPPLEIRDNVARREASNLALREYTTRLTPFVLAYPEQWRGWLHV